MEAGVEELADVKVLVAELMDEEAIDQLSAACQVDVKYRLSHEELLAIIPEYQGIIVRSETSSTRNSSTPPPTCASWAAPAPGSTTSTSPYATAEGRHRLQHPGEQRRLGG